MQLTIADAAKNKLLKDARMSIPESIKAKNTFENDFERDFLSLHTSTAGENVLVDLINKQHPLIHTWLLLSTFSICFLSAIFFIFPQ